MGRHSSSDSDYSSSRSSKRKKKSGRKRRSRSPSYDDSRRSHVRSSEGRRPDNQAPPTFKKNKRRSRSRSINCDRTSRRKRSRSRDRSRSSRSRDAGRRRSRDRSPSPVRRKKHVDAVLGVSTGTLKDIMDILPGFSKMAPSEQSKIRIQRALNAAVESSAAREAEGDANEDNLERDFAEVETSNIKDQIERAKAIQAIGDDEDDYDGDEFIPSHFRSSAKSKKKDTSGSGKKGFADRDSSHEIAIFGHSSLLSVDEALKKQETDDDARFKAKRMVDFAQRDPRSLMASDFLISHEEAAARWHSKLVSLRHRFADDLAAVS